MATSPTAGFSLSALPTSIRVKDQLGMDYSPNIRAGFTGGLKSYQDARLVGPQTNTQISQLEYQKEIANAGLQTLPYETQQKIAEAGAAKLQSENEATASRAKAPFVGPTTTAGQKALLTRVEGAANNPYGVNFKEVDLGNNIKAKVAIGADGGVTIIGGSGLLKSRLNAKTGNYEEQRGDPVTGTNGELLVNVQPYTMDALGQRQYATPYQKNYKEWIAQSQEGVSQAPVEAPKPPVSLTTGKPFASLASGAPPFTGFALGSLAAKPNQQVAQTPVADPATETVAQPAMTPAADQSAAVTPGVPTVAVAPAVTAATAEVPTTKVPWLPNPVAKNDPNAKTWKDLTEQSILYSKANAIVDQSPAASAARTKYQDESSATASKANQQLMALDNLNRAYVEMRQQAVKPGGVLSYLNPTVLASIGDAFDIDISGASDVNSAALMLVDKMSSSGGVNSLRAYAGINALVVGPKPSPKDTPKVFDAKMNQFRAQIEYVHNMAEAANSALELGIPVTKIKSIITRNYNYANMPGKTDAGAPDSGGAADKANNSSEASDDKFIYDYISKNPSASDADIIKALEQSKNGKK